LTRPPAETSFTDPHEADGVSSSRSLGLATDLLHHGHKVRGVAGGPKCLAGLHGQTPHRRPTHDNHGSDKPAGSSPRASTKPASFRKPTPRPHDPCRGFLPEPGVAQTQRRLPQVTVPHPRLNSEGVGYGIPAVDRNNMGQRAPSAALLGHGRNASDATIWESDQRSCGRMIPRPG